MKRKASQGDVVKNPEASKKEGSQKN